MSLRQAIRREHIGKDMAPVGAATAAGKSGSKTPLIGAVLEGRTGGLDPKLLCGKVLVSVYTSVAAAQPLPPGVRQWNYGLAGGSAPGAGAAKVDAAAEKSRGLGDDLAEAMCGGSKANAQRAGAFLKKRAAGPPLLRKEPPGPQPQTEEEKEAGNLLENRHQCPADAYAPAKRVENPKGLHSLVLFEELRRDANLLRGQHRVNPPPPEKSELLTTKPQERTHQQVDWPTSVPLWNEEWREWNREKTRLKETLGAQAVANALEGSAARNRCGSMPLPPLSYPQGSI